MFKNKNYDFPSANIVVTSSIVAEWSLLSELLFSEGSTADETLMVAGDVSAMVILLSTTTGL